ncbi:hypothetical protein TKK_0013770 [Trichogramma kaykai]
MPRKISRSERATTAAHLSRSKKRVPPHKRKAEEEETLSSTSSKKIKTSTAQNVAVNFEKHYAILDFFLVFTSLSNLLKCVQCNGKIEFQRCKKEGLGFSIKLTCEKCKPRCLKSSNRIASGPYEINTRFAFVMRILGLGLPACNKFCGLMDLTSNFLTKAAYNSYMKKICKVVDVQVKSAFCHECKYWEKKLDSAEYEEWKEEHVHNGKCSANYVGSTGGMEVEAIKEMFQRFMKNKVKYRNYIGDGDSKTYTDVVNSKPYGESFKINKKECVGHVQKRMGSRLRDIVKNTVIDSKTSTGKIILKKLLSSKGKLIGKMIDKLTVYHGLTIRRNHESVEKMKNAIWGTYHHYSSTDKNPSHEKCPDGENSWCEWQRASAEGNSKNFKHSFTALPNEVSEAIRPIYQDLSSDNLLQKCVGDILDDGPSLYGPGIDDSM